MILLSFPVAPAPEGLLELGIIREALRHADISVEKAALHMGIDKSLLSRQLSGDGHLSIRRLAMLPRDFWRWYMAGLMSEYDLPDMFIKAATVGLSLPRRDRQLKMDERKFA
jgi:hypothetical protein